MIIIIIKSSFQESNILSQTAYSRYEPDSKKIALNSFVYIAYKPLLSKGKWFIPGLILSKINAVQLVLIQFCVFFIDIHNKKIS